MNAPRVRHVGARRGPLPKLSALVAAQATGELVCAAEDLEVHVFLQRGRVAWATSSAAPLVFARELCARAGIEPEAFREVVEGCRHDRRPLGETLVAWKLASAEDVRACLAEQIRQALASLHGRTNVNALFLERGNRFAEYDTALTFSLEEVRTEPQPIDDPDLLGQLRASVPESRWVVVRHGGAARASWPSELDDDLDGVRGLGVDVLITLEETATVPREALDARGIRNELFPIPDMEAPSLDRAAALCARIDGLLAEGRVVAVHCLAGLGRTGTVLAAYAIWRGAGAVDAIDTVRGLRPRTIQSEAQARFLERFAERCQDDASRRMSRPEARTPTQE